jgi:hypothetical protein
MKSIEPIYNSFLLENQNTNNIDIELLKKCVEGTYTINEDGSIDVNGSVYINNNRDLIKIPFKFRNVSGYFICNDDQLTSLEGTPNSVGGEFWCSNNQLTSLEGGPSNVGGKFYCYGNKLISLEGAPSNVGGDFYCHGISNLPYSELFKIVDNVSGNIYYSSAIITEDKDKIRRDRDIKNILKDDELGNLDI